MRLQLAVGCHIFLHHFPPFLAAILPPNQKRRNYAGKLPSDATQAGLQSPEPNHFPSGASEGWAKPLTTANT